MESKIPAHVKGDLSQAGYLLRILAAFIRQSGGEVRVSGAEVDRVGEATSIVKEWDADKQQLVFRLETVGFREVWTLTPEKQAPPAPAPAPRVVQPVAEFFTPAPRPAQTAAIPEVPAEEFLPKRSTLDEPERLQALYSKRTVARAAAIVRDHLRQRDRERQKEEERIDL